MLAQMVLAAADDEMALAVVGMGMIVALIAIIVGAVKSVLRTRQIEQTKREVAAYVAEGTIAPEDAQRILSGGGSDFESKIGTAVTWGMISSGKAERLIRAFREEGRKSAG